MADRNKVHKGDGHSLEARKRDVYWLCECGVARIQADSIEEHVNEEEHFAEKIDETTGRVISFLAGGLNQQKYGMGIPDTAQVKREKLKNDPMFER